MKSYKVEFLQKNSTIKENKMRYELWDMVSYGNEEPLVPFTLSCRHDSFEIIYGKFLDRIKTVPCAIFIKTEKENEE